MSKKFKSDIIAKKADIIYKKLVVLLATVGGSGSYAISEKGISQYFLFVIFTIFVVGVIVNYLELNKLKHELEEIENE